MDKSGEVYGDFTVIEFDHVDISGHLHWKCQCNSCGYTVSYPQYKLTKEPKCGKCRSDRKHYKSEYYSTPEFNSYQSMLQRCTKTTNKDYKNYGGRGINVCERWLNSFEAFLEDMGKRPSGMTLDRIDYNGNYEKSNCRWAPEVVQNRNKRFRYQSLLFKVIKPNG